MAGFKEAMQLLGPLITVRSPLILNNEQLVSDAIQGFSFLYSKRGSEGMSRSQFLYYLAEEMYQDPGVPISKVIRRLSRKELGPIDPADPQVVETVERVFGAAIYLKKISGSLSRTAWQLRNARYDRYFKNFNRLSTTYQSQNVTKYNRAVLFLEELYNVYIETSTASGINNPLEISYFLLLLAINANFSFPSNGSSLQSLIEYIAQSRSSLNVKKTLGTSTIIALLIYVYGYDLPRNAKLFGKYAIKNE